MKTRTLLFTLSVLCASIAGGLLMVGDSRLFPVSIFYAVAGIVAAVWSRYVSPDETL